MQETRQFILDILRERGHATVDDIVDELQQRRGSITAVTVRHHLLRLQEEGLITSPQFKRRSSPGRPQHVYSLTEKASEYFPNNYQRLAATLIEQLGKQLPVSGVNVIFEGIAGQMACDAEIPSVPLAQRLDLVVEYLTRQGYDASWEDGLDAFVLRTVNCPYHHINTSGNFALCEMDMRLIAALLGVVPRRIGRMAAGDTSCAYAIPKTQPVASMD